jgi:hypothetical protein
LNTRFSFLLLTNIWCVEQPQTATINYREQDPDEGDDDIFGPAVLKDKLNTHHNVRADAKPAMRKAVTKKANTTTTTKTTTNKTRGKSKPRLESGPALPMKTNSTASTTPDSPALYAQLRQADAVINGLLACSTQLALEARDMTAEHARAELRSHECDLAPQKADFTSTATKATTKSAATANVKDAEIIAQLRRDLDKAEQEVAARDARVYEQAAELRRLTAEIKKLKAKAAAVAVAKENEATNEPSKRGRAQKKTIAAANFAAGKVGGAPKRRRGAAALTTLLETPPPPTRFQAPATKAAASTAAAATTAADKNTKAAPVPSFSATPFLSRKTKVPTAADSDNSVSPSASSRSAATEANKKTSLMVSLFDDDTSVDLSHNSSTASATTAPTTKSTKRATKRTVASKPSSPKKSQPAASRKKRRKLNPSAKLRLFQDDEDADDNDEEENGNDDYENNNDKTRNNEKLNGPILAAPGITNSGAGGRQISPLKARNRGLSFKV